MTWRKKVFFSGFILLILCVVYIAVQWRYINNTKDVPYKNLRDFSISGGCMVSFNIKYEDQIYPVILNNSHGAELLGVKNHIIKVYLFPIYLKEVIRNDWSIEVDESVYNDFGYDIVDKSLIDFYSNRDLISDTSIIKNGTIAQHLAGEHHKAIIYVLLRQGINCCQDDETGVVLVGMDR
jgi:hypothetical protein